MPDLAIHVKGLRELERAFKLADKAEAKMLRTTLKEAADPVRRLAEGKAVSRIRNLDGKWSQFRIGSRRSAVYLAPKQKGRASRDNRALRRPNLKDLLLDRAMIPALDERREEVVHNLEHMLDTVGSRWERA